MMASPSEKGNIELVGVTKHFGGSTAVDRVTLENAARFLLLSAWAVGMRKNHHLAFDRRPRNCKRR